MPYSLEELDALLASRESEHFECKEAKDRYDFELLVQYCVALANEGGGTIAFGISDQVPHAVVGSHAFPDKWSGLLGQFGGLVEVASI